METRYSKEEFLSANRGATISVEKFCEIFNLEFTEVVNSTDGPRFIEVSRSITLPNGEVIKSWVREDLGMGGYWGSNFQSHDDYIIEQQTGKKIQKSIF